MKTVYKYPTGGAIPEDAKYICTQIETTSVTYPDIEKENGSGRQVECTKKMNTLVWHYYEVPLIESKP